MDKPHSQACDNNKEPILDKLRQVFGNSRTVLEIGSGTGQHAVYFGRLLPHLTWQTSDLPAQHQGILAWLAESELDNVIPPITLDARTPRWPSRTYDGIFSANTLHILAWTDVQSLFAKIPSVLKKGGNLCVYGPFNYGGMFTSESNARFDAWLKTQNPLSGIREQEKVCQVAAQAGLELVNDHPMPANNRLLIWRR